MKKYYIVYSEQAMNDVDDLFYFIKIECHSPITAKKYMIGIFKTIELLSIQPESFSISDSKSTRQYGFDVRKTYYKKISIIYSIYGELVYIHRIMAGSLMY
jgi:plasmid stabilization system protein ParE